MSDEKPKYLILDTETGIGRNSDTLDGLKPCERVIVRGQSPASMIVELQARLDAVEARLAAAGL